MSCFKCKSQNIALRTYEMRELKKGSPSRGKNKQFITIKVKEISCRDCQSKEMTYE